MKIQGSIGKAVFLAFMSVLLTVAVATSLTLALFIETDDENIAKIQAGDVEIGAKFLTLEGKEVDNDPQSDTYGKLISITDTDKNKDLSSVEENLFNITNAVPKMYQKATVELTNNGTVAFTYQIKLVDLNLSVGELARNQALSEQILITVEVSGAEKCEFLLADLADSENVFGERTLLPGKSEKVSITATFLNDADGAALPDDLNTLTPGDNNLAQGGNLSFDITIIATQSVS